MFLILLIFITFSTFMVFSYRTKFAYVMSVYFFGFMVLIFSGIMYFVSITAYKMGNSLDYWLFQILSNLKMNINDISVMHNLGIAIIMAASPVCVNLVYRCQIGINILLFVPIAFFLYMHQPNVDWSVFLQLNTGVNSIIAPLQNLATAFAAVYLISPVAVFGVYTAKTKIFVKKRYGIACLICMLLIYVVIYLLFLGGDICTDHVL